LFLVSLYKSHILNGQGFQSLVVDTLDYPDHHTFFSFSQDSDISPPILQAIETVTMGRPRSIRDAVEMLLLSLFRAINASSHDVSVMFQESQEADEEEDEDARSYDAYDVFDDFCVGQNSSSKIMDLLRLQRQVLPPACSVIIITNIHPPK
jgi:ubiquitin-conjugating enzyme E2 Q